MTIEIRATGDGHAVAIVSREVSVILSADTHADRFTAVVYGYTYRSARTGVRHVRYATNEESRDRLVRDARESPFIRSVSPFMREVYVSISPAVMQPETEEETSA